MKRKKICFVGQFPPPMSGLTKAIETLYNSHLKEEFYFEMIDIKENKKIISTLIKLLKSDADLFYFTISQTRAGNWRDLVIMNLLSIRKKKCLIHLHGGYYRTLIDKDCGSLQRKLNYNAISRLAGAIVLGESLKYIFEGMINNDRIFVVPNCVDNQFLMSDEILQEKLKAVTDKKVFNVLYLSNFIESKGYREVLQLAKIAKNNDNKTFKFKFAGKFFEEKDRIFFQSYIKDNELEEWVEYKGIVYGEEKVKLLNECDIFILLTRYLNEGQPISILEAMGNGMVVVTTDHAGIPDIVKGGENGFVFDKNTINVQFVMNSITSLKDKPDVWKGIVEKNYYDILSKYKEDIYIRNIGILFRKI